MVEFDCVVVDISNEVGGFGDIWLIPSVIITVCMFSLAHALIHSFEIVGS